MTIKTPHTAANESFSGVIDNTDQAKVGASIALIERKQQGRVDSRLLAEHLAVQHKNVLALIDDNKAEFEEFDRLAFETRVVKRKQGIAAATDYHAIYQRAKINVKSVTYTGNPIPLSTSVNLGPKQTDMAGGE